MIERIKDKVEVPTSTPWPLRFNYSRALRVLRLVGTTSFLARLASGSPFLLPDQNEQVFDSLSSVKKVTTHCILGAHESNRSWCVNNQLI